MVMVRSSAVGFLLFALCLFAFLSESADGTSGEAAAITEQEATKAVEGAKNSSTKVWESAGSEINNIKLVSDRLEAFKTKANEAESKATEAAQKAEETAKTDNEAAVIVTNLKNIAKTLITLHSTAKDELQKAVAILNAVLTRATTLKDDSSITLQPNDTSENAYKAENKKALDITQSAKALENNITEALQIMSTVLATENTMNKNWEKTRVETFHVIVIATVANIQTMNGDADSIIKQTESKKDEVNAIVKKMQEIKTKAPSSLIKSFDALIKSANDEFSNAKSAVDNAMSYKTAIEDQKNTALAALAKFKTETDVSESQKEADKTNTCVTAIGNIIPQLQSELETASRSVTNANISKQEMERAMSQATSEQNAGEVRETAKSDIQVGDGTENDQKHTTKQPTITNSEQLMSKESLNQGDNSTEREKDALINGAQNVPTTALTGGKAPAPGAKNDSAMTVSVPLLLALIASAVLQ